MFLEVGKVKLAQFAKSRASQEPQWHQPVSIWISEPASFDRAIFLFCFACPSALRPLGTRKIFYRRAQ
jgi:hypothetical protein